VVEVIVPLPPGDAQMVLPVNERAGGFAITLTVLLVEEQGVASVAIT
jgi:hypothetical protein